MIPVFAPWLSENVRRYVLDCVDSGWISSLGAVRGTLRARLRRASARPGHAVATSNGTTALHLCLATLGIGPADEVLVPDLTFVSTANVVRYTGATPVLVDSEPRTWGMDPVDARRKITPRTRAIIPVHLYGHPVDMDPLLALAAEHRLDIVEDAAEAHGARYKGRRVGALGRIGAFSFYGNKIITTGEGGMVVTNDPRLAERAAFLRDHAMDPRRRYYHPEIGFNYRMTNIQAAIGCAQLEQVDAILARRKVIADAYETGLAGDPGAHPAAGRAVGRERPLDVLGPRRAGVSGEPRCGHRRAAGAWGRLPPLLRAAPRAAALPTGCAVPGVDQPRRAAGSTSRPARASASRTSPRYAPRSGRWGRGDRSIGRLRRSMRVRPEPDGP